MMNSISRLFSLPFCCSLAFFLANASSPLADVPGVVDVHSHSQSTPTLTLPWTIQGRKQRADDFGRIMRIGEGGALLCRTGLR